MTEIFKLLLAWSWNAALLLGFVWILSRFLQSSPARIRHHVWLGALAAIAVFPLWSGFADLLSPLFSTEAVNVFAPIFNLPQEAFSPLSAGAANSGEIVVDLTELTKTPSFDWSFYVSGSLLALWLVGVVLTGAKVLAESVRLHRVLSDSHPVTLCDLGCSPISEAEIGAVSIRLARSALMPMLTGVFRPAILLPADMREWTTAEELIWILRHELAHLSRGDNFTVVFQTLLGIVFFFHPPIRYALGQLSVEREAACDELVIDSGANPVEYAESLLKAAARSVTFQSGGAPVLSFSARKTLQKRIGNILNSRPSLAAGKSRALLALSALLIISAMGLLGCSRTFLTSNEREIRDFLNQIRNAEISGSIDEFDRLTAPEFVRVGADGDVSNKEQTLDFIRRSGKSNIQTIEIQNEQIRIYGNDAVVTGLGIANGEDAAGRKFVVRNFCTFVLVKRDGRWQCASVQQTRLDSNQASARIAFNFQS